MQAFSSVLSELYQAAENPVPQAFQQEAFRLLRQLLFFDGGISGVLAGENRTQRNPRIVHAAVYGRNPELLLDYQAVAGDDLVMRRLLNGIGLPYGCSCLQMYKERHLLHLFAFAKKHEISEALVFGEPSDDTGNLRWISLYRRSAHPFDAEDAMMVRAWWPHLVRATQFNLRHALERRYEGKNERAVALLDMLGRIEVGDRLFSEMLREEWPKEPGQRLPKAAWDSLQQKGLFKGRVLSLSACAQADYIVCEAQYLSDIDRLGALERTVALLVAEGHDYKSIASRMGTSPNTVRNQISRIYKKLNVHDKLSLALAFRRAEESSSPLASSLPASETLSIGTRTRSPSFPLNSREKRTI